MVVSLILNRGNEIFSFHYLALVTWQSVSLSSGPQHEMPQNLAENGETVLMGMECLNTRSPGSLCLPYYVRDYLCEVNI